MKEKLGYWYVCGLWSERMLRQAVEKGVITAADYEEITETADALRVDATGKGRTE